MSRKVLILKGDHIGPEIVNEAIKVLHRIDEKYQLGLQFEEGLLGGSAFDAVGDPCPETTLEKARQSDAILMGSVGGPEWDGVDRQLRPEKGLLKLRSDLGLFGNLRPAILYPQLAGACSLKPEIVSLSLIHI